MLCGLLRKPGRLAAPPRGRGTGRPSAEGAFPGFARAQAVPDSLFWKGRDRVGKRFMGTALPSGALPSGACFRAMDRRLCHHSPCPGGQGVPGVPMGPVPGVVLGAVERGPRERAGDTRHIRTPVTTERDPGRHSSRGLCPGSLEAVEPLLVTRALLLGAVSQRRLVHPEGTWRAGQGRCVAGTGPPQAGLLEPGRCPLA